MRPVRGVDAAAFVLLSHPRGFAAERIPGGPRNGDCGGRQYNIHPGISSDTADSAAFIVWRFIEIVKKSLASWFSQS